MTSSPPLSAGTQSREASLGNPLSFSGAYGPLSPDINVKTPKRENSESENDTQRTWRSGEKLKFPLDRKKDPWKDCHELVKRYDRALCRGWTEEITNLLILSGLFSAVVTAFAVESYQWLQPNSQDLSYLALLHLSTQLSAGTNSTLQAPFVPPAFHPAEWQVRVNIVWFLSLVLSVTTAMIGILVIQWLREYERGSNLAPKEALALRQMLHEGLKSWHVQKILYALPLLLQTALVLFFVGLLILLWNVNREVAGVAGAFLALTLVFIALTTIMPTLQFLIPLNEKLRVPQCPYKSLQSWAFFRLISTLTWLLSARIIPLGVRILERLLKRWVPPSPPSSSSSSTTSSSSSSSSSSDPENPRPRLRRQLTILTDIQDTMTNMKKWYLSWWRYEDKMWKIPSWEGFDLYWRYTRDESDPESESKDEQHLSAYDTIRGLQWVSRKLPLGVDATYAIHPCLLDLDVSVAVNALRVLSRTPGDEKVESLTSGEMDSLDWLLHFHRRNKGPHASHPHAESDPLHKDILSLLAIRHLNSDSILHPDVRNHYLEMFVRIRNAGNDVKGFFDRPLRHVDGDTDINNLSEGGYVLKMFEFFEFSVPDETMLQIMIMILADVRGTRGELDVGTGTTGQRVVIDSSGERMKPLHEQLREKWKLLQLVWKVLVRLLKHPRSLSSASSMQSTMLDYAFQLCDEMSLYIPLLRQHDKYNTRHIDELLAGLCTLYESIGDTAFESLRAYPGFEKLRSLAGSVSVFVGGSQDTSVERKKWKGGVEGRYLRMDSVLVGEGWASFAKGVEEVREAGKGVEVNGLNGHERGGGHAVEATDDTLVESEIVVS
ncbi:hypothetical protein BDQ17DRAFT_1289793 [Cyathus striatus]|nr:hypothetical protein BDQ17DRAFT_1289793 [Cyathus striatus]